MKFSRAAIAFYVGLVFASGAVLGAFGHRLYAVSSVSSKPGKMPPEEFRKKVVAEYQSRLKLNDDQVLKLNTILDETRVRIEDTRQKMHPAYQKIREEQNEKFRNLLTPEQQSEFDKMHREREERQKQNGGRGPGSY
jgi:Spy/CpxP family protein refolding chaperone